MKSLDLRKITDMSSFSHHIGSDSDSALLWRASAGSHDITMAGAVELPSETVRLVGHAETRALQQSSEGAQQSMVVELDVNVEYTAGCQRSHAARMAVPVTEPMRYMPTAQPEASDGIHEHCIETDTDWVL